jgi:acetate---CoA ligase (ADP-forming)
VSGTAAPTSVGHELVRKLLEIHSVAVVGASARPHSVGAVAVSQLVDGGFVGRVVPVNPRYDSVAGLRCYPALDALPDPVDLAVLAVADRALEEQLELARVCGARAAVVFGGYSGVAGDGAALALRLAAIARRGDMALCGPNVMGFIDFRRGLRVVGFHEPLSRRPGSTTFLSQSGSVFSAMLHNTRGLEFDLAVSTGQEAVLSVADYLFHALERETTTVIGLFLEALRDGPAAARPPARGRGARGAGGAAAPRRGRTRR